MTLDTSVLSYAAGDPAFDGSTPGTSNLYRRTPTGPASDTLGCSAKPAAAGAPPNAPT